MIIFWGSDSKIKEKISNMLSKERIIFVDSIYAVLEQFAKHSKETDLVIVHWYCLEELLLKEKEIKESVGLELGISSHLIGYYRKEEENNKRLKELLNKNYFLIKYDENDQDFPIKFIDLIKNISPKLNVDLEQAKRTWKGEIEKGLAKDELEALRAWMGEQGILPSSETSKQEEIRSIDEFLINEPESSEEKAYQDLIKTYQNLQSQYKELVKQGHSEKLESTKKELEKLESQIKKYKEIKEIENLFQELKRN